ncbi:hypothetical protein A2U01_0113512, partial [Trifolium medium]|nr:hypothetical protein [Trifolium medium]
LHLRAPPPNHLFAPPLAPLPPRAQPPKGQAHTQHKPLPPFLS